MKTRSSRRKVHKKQSPKSKRRLTLRSRRNSARKQHYKNDNGKGLFEILGLSPTSKTSPSTRKNDICVSPMVPNYLAALTNSTEVLNYLYMNPARLDDYQKAFDEWIKTRKCLKCNKKANYNIPSQKIPQYCDDHVEAGMVDTKEQQICYLEKILNDYVKKYT